MNPDITTITANLNHKILVTHKAKNRGQNIILNYIVVAIVVGVSLYKRRGYTYPIPTI